MKVIIDTHRAVRDFELLMKAAAGAMRDCGETIEKMGSAMRDLHPVGKYSYWEDGQLITKEI